MALNTMPSPVELDELQVPRTADAVRNQNEEQQGETEPLRPPTARRSRRKGAGSVSCEGKEGESYLTDCAMGPWESHLALGEHSASPR